MPLWHTSQNLPIDHTSFGRSHSKQVYFISFFRVLQVFSVKRFALCIKITLRQKKEWLNIFIFAF
jgi:hypothetical protein